VNNTLVKGIALLEMLAHSDRPLGVTELAARAGLGKSNAHRLLQALVELGYARHDADAGTYSVSIRLWELGSAVLANLDLRRVAEPWMQRLLEDTRETVHLSVLDGDEVVYVHKLDSPEPVRAYSQIGGRAPAHCVATGKALLAAQPPRALMALPDVLPQFTPKTLVRRADLLAALEQIRVAGYATNLGEWHAQVGGAAAVIRDHAGRPVAALGLTVPVERLKPEVLRRYVPRLTAAADEISRLMGAPAAEASARARDRARV